MNSRKDLQKAVKKLRKLVFTPKSNVEVFRQEMEREFSTVFLPNRVERKEIEYSGVKCDILEPALFSSRKLILYIHGGSFVGGSRSVYRNFCASIANTCSCRVALPEYSLAPTHPFPQGLEDIQKFYTSLYTEEQIVQSLEDKNHLPEIYLFADGSGASIAMALMHSLVGKFRSSIKQIVLFSPWVDLRRTGIDSKTERKIEKSVEDKILSFDAIKLADEVYTYEANLVNPQVSPATISDEKVKDFPPVFIQMGEHEILTESVFKYKQFLGHAGVKVDLDIWKDMPFMFQMADDCLEEAHLAVEKIGKILI